MDAIILAGGSAVRLGGANKALLQVGGERFIDRILRTLAPL
ncbi:MAG TPA: NTP transferase domain-containing protein, partial [Spirochaetia bacterium]|nr:NTP transferase domain-containing protein [Spirochaetia bacterium]